MEEVIRFALLGFGVGALYALASQGLIIIYRGSGVLNFALGAIGMAGAYVWYELHVKGSMGMVPATVLGVAASAAIGAFVHLAIMRPLRHVSPLVRVIATLGVLITLQAIAVLRYEATPLFVPSELPTDVWKISGTIVISADRVILILAALVITIALWAIYKYTKFGLATSAVAENERSAGALGLSPDRIATANWALGSGLAGLAAIFIVPIVTLQPSVLTNLVLAATAAALVAGFRSFPVAFIAGLALGIAQTEVGRYVSQPGVAQAVPFAFVVVWLVIRGQALPLRDYLLQRLPTIGSGRIHWSGIAFGVALMVFLMAVTPPVWNDAFNITFIVAFSLLSIVVLTGYTGQLSLAQVAIGGFGAWVAGRLAASQDIPFLLALLIGVAATVPLGLIFALPAVRTRGINLAVVTLGLGTSISLIIFNNTEFTGGFGGTQVEDPTFFGMNMSAISHPMRWGLFCMLLFILVVLAVSNVRRGRSGRRLIAVRTNERAAAALGISVPGAKLYAFGLSAGIAAIAGILSAFRSTSITYTVYDSFTSITHVGFAMIGGIGYLFGPILGATLAPGALNNQILNVISEDIGKYVPLIGGIFTILLVLANQNGMAKETIAQLAFVRGKLSGVMPFMAVKERPRTELPEHEETARKVDEKVLDVTGLTVRYGGTTAVDDLSLQVRPGQIVGLIGPNGAGKTTAIDAITGFTKAAEGVVVLDGDTVNGWSPTKRARAGLGRSFQSLELFEDSTVLDNIRAASDSRDFGSYFRDLLYPKQEPLPSEVVTAIKEFRLAEDLDTVVEDLPYGRRRLLAIARAVATQPSVLLLDEPAAGLGDVETAELAELVRRLADDWGIAILLVEHDMNFVMSVCDEIVVLDFGRKICEGTPDVVRRDPAVIAAYLGETEEEAAAEGIVPAAVGGIADVEDRS